MADPRLWIDYGWIDPAIQAAVWSAVTIAVYRLAKGIHGRWPRVWLMPLAVAPVLLGVAILLARESYADYIRGTGWLVTLLGPATVAFAVPIYEQRALIRRHWPLLVVGMIAGSLTAVASSWALAAVLGVDGELRTSLLPRSISTPFAIEMSSAIGGNPDLTAVFVILTGLVGGAVGELLLVCLPLRSALARGALFGVAAHAVGTATAYRVGREEGSIAGLAMVLAGLMNVLAAPVVVTMLR